MNVWDILLGGLVALLLLWAIYRMVRDKKRGKCSCGCDGCAQKDGCAAHVTKNNP